MIHKVKYNDTLYGIQPDSSYNRLMNAAVVDIISDEGTVTCNGITAVVEGNRVTLNGTCTGAMRIKLTNELDANATIKDAWKLETIPKVLSGHEYATAVTKISGTVSTNSHFNGYSSVSCYDSSGSGHNAVRFVSDEGVYTLGTDYSPNRIALSTYPLVAIYIQRGTIFSNVVLQIEMIDLTNQENLLGLSPDVQEVRVLSEMNNNRLMGAAIVDIISHEGTVTYNGVTAVFKGNRVTLNGTSTGALRIKLTNDIDAYSSIKDAWKTETIPNILDDHKYATAVTKISGTVSTNEYFNGYASVSCYDSDGNGHRAVRFVSDAGAYELGTSYSPYKIPLSDYPLVAIYIQRGTIFNNVVLQIEMIDLTNYESLLGIANAVNNESNEPAEYYFENGYLYDRIEDILGNAAGMGISGDSFVWFTDPHYYRPNSGTLENGFQSEQLIEYLRKRTNVRWVFCGGDMLRGNLTSDVCTKYLEKCREYLNPIYDHLFMCLGNHEYNNPGVDPDLTSEELDTPQVYAMLSKHQEDLFGSVSEKGDYWVDNAAQKLRYFFLGCNKSAALFTETISWFADEMTKVPAGYTVVVLSHVGLNTTLDAQGYYGLVSTFQHIANIMDAANSKSSYTYDSVTYSYSSVNFTVAAALTGHVHFDGKGKSTGGIPIISTACDRAFVGTDGNDLVRKIRKPGTIGEQVIEFVQIDTVAKKIMLTRIGGSIAGASYDSETGLIYDTTAGTGTEYDTDEWVIYSPYKDRVFTY